VNSAAKKFLILNLDSASANGHRFNSGEFAGYTPLEHVKILQDYAPGLSFDYLISDESLDLQGDELQKHLSSTGGELIAADLRDNATLIHHSSKKLTSLFAHIARKSLIG
jgi:hypothetical protein